MEKGKKIYFASDVHLGAPTIENHREHEQRFVRWLHSVKDTAAAVYLLGDIFDFWYEYRQAVPKGFTRFLGTLCELTDAGIPVHFFTGNHDIWIFDYLPEETGIIVHKQPLVTELYGRRFFIAHGDGLTRYETSYNRLKAVFTNPAAQWLFRWLHPDIGIRFAASWSKQSRKSKTGDSQARFRGEENEWLILWAKEMLAKEYYDYFVFGHRHVALNMELNNKSRLVYLGDWVSLFTYGEWNGTNFELKKFVE
ncbi:MAG: UDP-2,3-diacylglucosamine diphosphatase [Cytophagaceae bacterium]|nr:UDP-2,3-diacylglucosamine diphosphatase [Cytophagaceae bacterium]